MYLMQLDMPTFLMTSTNALIRASLPDSGICQHIRWELHLIATFDAIYFVTR